MNNQLSKKDFIGFEISRSNKDSSTLRVFKYASSSPYSGELFLIKYESFRNQFVVRASLGQYVGEISRSTLNALEKLIK